MELQQLNQKMNLLNRAINSGKLSPEQLQQASKMMIQLSSAISNQAGKTATTIASRLEHIAAVMERIEAVDVDLKKIGVLLDQADYTAPKRALTLLTKLENTYDVKVADQLWDQLVKDGVAQTNRIMVLLKQVKETLSLARVQQSEGGEDIERKKIAQETHDNFKKLIPWCTKMQENLNRLGFSEEASFIGATKSAISELVVKLSKV